MADTEWAEFLRGVEERAATWSLPAAEPRHEVKATTGGSGPGAYALEFYPQIGAFQRDPNRMMNEALGLYRRNPWVAIAERTIAWRFARVLWHLEDEEANTIEDAAAGVGADELAVQQLLERPSAVRTRSQLWSLTSRHLGLTGNAFWVPDQSNGLGMPLELLYINPVRMTPRLDAAGNLLGWVVDGPDNQVSGRPGNPGLPLDRDEVIHFTLDEPDFGVWGIGIAEAAQTKIELDRLATQHESQVFASGGRLTGIVSPKPNSGVEVNDDQWKSMIREWRNVTSDPEAAKRLIISKGPIDFIPTSSNNEQLQLVELAGQGRDDILNAWGVPLSQIGISGAAGLNSGEKNKNDEAILWQNVIEPRVEAFREKIQYELLDRIAVTGPRLELVIESPSFDDSTPLFDLAQKSATVAMTNDERREIIGLDPLDDKEYGALGKAVYVVNSMTSLFDPTIPVSAPPAPPPVAPEPPSTSLPAMVDGAAKAQLAPRELFGLRRRLQPTWERKVHAAVSAHLAEQRAMISDNVRQRYAQVVKKPTDRQAWWNARRWDASLLSRLEPLLVDYARTVGNRTTRTLKKATKGDGDWLTRVVAAIKDHGGDRIGGINDTTRDRVQSLIEQGVSDGLGPAELGSLIEDDAIFDEARAELIARTETAIVYNEAAIGSYREFDVTEVEAIDGDQDEECAERNGQIFSLDEAESIEDHPNGTLDWVPVVKAELAPDVPGLIAEAEARMAQNMNERPLHVEVHPPVLSPAPIVNVEAAPAPQVNMDTSSFALALDELRQHMTRPVVVTKTVQRDASGRIVAVIEEQA